MPTTTAKITIANDIASTPIGTAKTMYLYKEGSGTEGEDTMLSASKKLASVASVDLVAYTAAGSATHNFLYINNPSTNAKEYFIISMGDTPSSDVEQIGRLYAGDWMMIPWAATSAAYDVFIKPSVATEMTVEYMILS